MLVSVTICDHCHAEMQPDLTKFVVYGGVHGDDSSRLRGEFCSKACLLAYVQESCDG